MTTTCSDLVSGDYVCVNGERYYRIANTHRMQEFFMSLVGSSDHWMFISSSGALTAGRCDPDNALFPYTTDDQISAARQTTGTFTRLNVNPEAPGNTEPQTWTPLTSNQTTEGTSRNLLKTPLGNKLIFEEINHSLELTFRYRWAYSEKYGFVRSCQLTNHGKSTREMDLLDGFRNILPYGLGSEFMMRFSNLGNAYKKNELLTGSGLGLFYLSSIPTDKAEPSEGLMATTVWQTGLQPQVILLSSEQLTQPCSTTKEQGNFAPQTEKEIRGKSGAYLVGQQLRLEAGESKSWHLVAELQQDHSQVINLDQWLTTSDEIALDLESDIDAGETQLKKIIASADGFQCGSNSNRNDRHSCNTIFNVMRGGIPLAAYEIPTADFQHHLKGFNPSAYQRHQSLLEGLPEKIDRQELNQITSATNDPDLIRLSSEYLPLAFSRRHGDPTRPWNRFAISLRSDTGEANLSYQGNWRDIFQNWEALAVSFPRFSGAMLCRFLNATTADGYNPYRLTKDGFDWESPSPDDPWANIGYWGDHQIIYLLKLLEANRNIEPADLDELLTSKTFVHANVPYRIKNYDAIKADPHETIDFNEPLAEEIDRLTQTQGTDGKLLRDQSGEVHRVTLLEKLLILSLTKLSNFVPGGGIWLNTQRPEWNDANNALVGNGLSMVTTYYLYRWFTFIEKWLSETPDINHAISLEVANLFERLQGILEANQTPAGSENSASPGGYESQRGMPPREREKFVDALGTAASQYRSQIYESGPSGKVKMIPRSQCLNFFALAKSLIRSTIDQNRREDGLYHAYNLLSHRDNGLHLENLDEMLEGQVAVLSSGLLSPDEVAELLDTLRNSKLYRENQNSYLLYPDRRLPSFLSKNNVDAKILKTSKLIGRLIKDGDDSIVTRDNRGGLHFNGSFRNSNDLKAALRLLDDRYQRDVEHEINKLAKVFSELFEHQRFTGRSGTFYGYEGLGSIYWHMVSKLGLSVCENYFKAIALDATNETTARIRRHYESIREGIGAEKSPDHYGAFPLDPYSHTPENAGVKQPGMTGQVKEDILSRFQEVGIHLQDGCIHFRMQLFDKSELTTETTTFKYCATNGSFETLPIAQQSFAFTLCQVPFIYHAEKDDTITVNFTDGSNRSIPGTVIDREICQRIYSRSGEIESIHCSFRGLMQS
ncbi:hypothetical protein OAA19_01645 [Rubripirellula sp.]|nr:hypothetical protein [Rubripirellula sp.]MDB4338790.1 hypothetical protein [Rubripirellula sp.]